MNETRILNTKLKYIIKIRNGHSRTANTKFGIQSSLDRINRRWNGVGNGVCGRWDRPADRMQTTAEEESRRVSSEQEPPSREDTGNGTSSMIHPQKERSRWRRDIYGSVHREFSKTSNRYQSRDSRSSANSKQGSVWRKLTTTQLISSKPQRNGKPERKILKATRVKGSHYLQRGNSKADSWCLHRSLRNQKKMKRNV